jgi:hypothetical protein
MFLRPGTAPQVFCESMPNSSKLYINSIPSNQPPLLTEASLRKLTMYQEGEPVKPKPTYRASTTTTFWETEPIIPKTPRQTPRSSTSLPRARVFSPKIPKHVLPLHETAGALPSVYRPQRKPAKQPEIVQESPFPRIRVLLSVLPIENRRGKYFTQVNTTRLGQFVAGADKGSIERRPAERTQMSMSHCQIIESHVKHHHPFNVLCAKGVWQ